MFCTCLTSSNSSLKLSVCVLRRHARILKKKFEACVRPSAKKCGKRQANQLVVRTTLSVGDLYEGYKTSIYTYATHILLTMCIFRQLLMFRSRISLLEIYLSSHEKSVGISRARTFNLFFINSFPSKEKNKGKENYVGNSGTS